VDYEQLTEAGSMMGSGGMVVMDEDDCMVDMAKYFLTFTQDESCGKCTPCREGTLRMLEILERITLGKGVEEDLALLEELSHFVIDSSLCALGGSAPNPVLTTLKYFRQEYETHIREKKCPAQACRKLNIYAVDADLCVAKGHGCGVCLRNCPEKAIAGIKNQAHSIDQALCTKCGVCFDVCKFEAIKIT
jgi:Pyruvate/2-oxoacid:ferredoxin oxidoreductase delta subunit